MLGDAWALVLQAWKPVLIAFATVRVLPRVVGGEDLDDGLTGNGVSILARLARGLGVPRDGPSYFMDAFNLLFAAIAIALLLRAGGWLREGVGKATLFGLQMLLAGWLALALFAELLIRSTISYSLISMIFILLPAVVQWLMLVATPTAVAERKLLPAAMLRGLQLWRQAPIRLAFLLLLVLLLERISSYAESLFLKAFVVQDATLFDWVTTIAQEFVSGAHLPLNAAIMVAAWQHLRRRADGVPVQETAAIFD